MYELDVYKERGLVKFMKNMLRINNDQFWRKQSELVVKNMEVIAMTYTYKWNIYDFNSDK